VVVPAPELLSIDVAVGRKIGMIGTFRKGGHIDDPCPYPDKSLPRIGTHIRTVLPSLSYERRERPQSHHIKQIPWVAISPNDVRQQDP